MNVWLLYGCDLHEERYLIHIFESEPKARAIYNVYTEYNEQFETLIKYSDEWIALAEAHPNGRAHKYDWYDIDEVEVE